MKTILFIIFILSLSSCATMNKENCLSANWEAIGLSDASNQHQNLFDRYVNDCREFGVSPSSEKYTLGFNKGLSELCTFQNGYLIGNEGAILPRICPIETQDKFVQGFIEGQRNHDQKMQNEKQNALLEKSLNVQEKILDKNTALKCTYHYQCGANQNCVSGYCK